MDQPQQQQQQLQQVQEHQEQEQEEQEQKPAPTFTRFLLYAFRNEMAYPFIYLLFETIIPVSFPTLLSGHLVTPTSGASFYSLLLDLSMKLVPYWFLAIYHYTLGAPARLFFALVHSRRPLFGPGDGPGDGPGGLEDGPGEGSADPAVLVGDNRALLLGDNGQAEEQQQQQQEEEIVEVEFSYEELEALLLVIIWTQVLRLDAYYHPISANGLVHPVVATSLAIITKYFNILSFFIFWRVILEY